MSVKHALCRFIYYASCSITAELLTASPDTCLCLDLVLHPWYTEASEWLFVSWFGAAFINVPEQIGG